MHADPKVLEHYESGQLLQRLDAELRQDGIEPVHATPEDLAPYDQFHGRGIEATTELAGRMPAGSSDHLLDIGSGLAGPARYMARHFGCRVTGIDLSGEFCTIARILNGRQNCADQITVEQGDAQAMPFTAATFDGAYTMNATMNIADDRALFGEVHRVLKPGGWLMLSEVARGPGPGPDFPLPWANEPASSFLASKAEFCTRLEASGFVVERLQDMTEAALDYARRTRRIIDAGGRPPHRAVPLILGDRGEVAIRNLARAVRNRATVPIEVFCRRSGR